jgi:hypothetical protein
LPTPSSFWTAVGTARQIRSSATWGAFGQDRLEVKTTRTANQEGQESFFNAKGSWRQGWIAGLTHRNGCQAGEAGRSKACLADYPGNTPGVRYRTNIFGFSWIWQRTSGPASTR